MLSGIAVCLLGGILDLPHVSSDSNRIARVIHGEEIDGRFTGYDSISYFAAVSKLHGVSAWGKMYGSVICGGALITPGIVQTACHCLTYTAISEATNILRPVVMQEWESTVVVYIGVNKRFDNHELSMASVGPLKSQKFLIDHRCGQLPNGTVGTHTHDFGWISVDSKWDGFTSSLQLFNLVKFAPLYTVEELAGIWAYLIERRPVCLTIGFGPIDRNMRIFPRELRHGWSTLVPYSKCIKWTEHGLQNIHKHPHQLISWVCTLPFSKHYQSTAPGDSGGPFTCNNLYFGIVLGRENNLSIPDSQILNFHTAIAFAPQQNAKEYRRIFMEFVAQSGTKPFADFILSMDHVVNPNPTFKAKLKPKINHELFPIHFRHKRTVRFSHP